ncbi:hypothetical protein OED01_09125 [Microbacterium sp. M28]|uniref:hypothetical protein n=1 Tax=Microbacterium sp. M28 TaxID=2962064 RepID=UPI0021F4B055|nr:hypothetical protein [Microbacterium sp. M28]UYO95774.1 hypothetical protein OED01_09125 [Microbacterium sp. M28]
MNIMDTIIWLANFPVTHGYAMVFIAAFSLMGLFAQSFRAVGRSSQLSVIRQREGLPEPSPAGSGRIVFAHAQRIFFRVLTAVMAASLVLGILGLIGVPVTSAYIFANGESAAATLEDDWVTFTTSTGETYTLPNDFFTPSMYPDRTAWVSTGADIAVRYLPSHPQAYVIDTTQLAD